MTVLNSFEWPLTPVTCGFVVCWMRQYSSIETSCDMSDNFALCPGRLLYEESGSKNTGSHYGSPRRYYISTQHLSKHIKYYANFNSRLVHIFLKCVSLHSSLKLDCVIPFSISTWVTPYLNNPSAGENLSAQLSVFFKIWTFQKSIACEISVASIKYSFHR